MPILDPFRQRGPGSAQYKQYEFTDAANPGDVLFLELRQLDGAERLAAGDFATEMVREYLSPGPGRQPKPFRPLADGRKVKLSPGLIFRASQIYLAQKPGQDGTPAPYTFVHICAFSVTMEDAFYQMLDVAEGKLSGIDAEQEKKADLDTDTSLESQSNDSGSIPNTLPE